MYTLILEYVRINNEETSKKYKRLLLELRISFLYTEISLIITYYKSYFTRRYVIKILDKNYYLEISLIT